MAGSSSDIPRYFVCLESPVGSTEDCSGNNCGAVSDEETLVLAYVHTSANVTQSYK